MASSHDDPPSPPPLPVENGHANRDPLTHEPGAHPVGVGVGAAGAGAVGALLGAVAGPVGVLVGSVVGAFAGGLVGKDTAESVNPTGPGALANPGVVVDPAAETVADDPGFAPPPIEITATTAYPEDNVRDAAYFRYLERQRAGESGDDVADWAAAEREVLGG